MVSRFSTYLLSTPYLNISKIQQIENSLSSVLIEENFWLNYMRKLDNSESIRLHSNLVFLNGIQERRVAFMIQKSDM
jgi:hypothetical protein